jgi:hypothetical protein
MAKKPPKQGSNRTGIKSGPHALATGPKPVVIDWAVAGRLAEDYNTIAAIASKFNLKAEQFSKRYAAEHDGEKISEFIELHRGKMQLKIRAKLISMFLEDSNMTAGIHLAKFLLGEVERKVETIDDDRPPPIQITEENLDHWIEVAKSR